MSFAFLKNKKWFFHACIQTFQESDQISSIFLQKLCIFLYFGQVFSFIFKHYLQKLISQTTLALSYVLFSLEFSNFLIFFLSDKFYFTCFYTAFSFLTLLFIILIIYSIVWRKIVKRVVIFINSLLKYSLVLFFWIFYMPVLNLFVNSFENSWYSFHEKTCSLGEYIIAIIGCFLSIFFGVLTLMFNSNFDFCELRGLRITYNIYWLIVFVLRTVLLLMFPFFESNSYFVYLILSFFCALTIYHFYVYSPLRNQEISNFYLATLFSFMIITFEFLAYDYLNLLVERNLFYVSLISIITAFKFGQNLQSYLENKKLLKQVKKQKNISIYILEEIKTISGNFMKDEKYRFQLMGIIKNHQKYCRLPDCKILSKKILAIGADLFTLDQLINHFIEFKFRMKQKKVKKAKFLYKYLTFFQKYESNLVKSFYEIERATHLFNIQDKGGFFDIICTVIRESAVFRLKNLEKTKHAPSSEKKHLDLPTFFRSLKLKEGYEKDFKEIMNDKRNFWESYLTSIQSMQGLMAFSSRLTVKIEKMREKLEINHRMSNNDAFKFINLKFLTMFHSIIVNTVNVSMKYQEEFDNLLKHSGSMEKELSHKSFLEKNTVTCMISFKNKVGMLKDQQKNVKLAHLFGYTSEDLKNLKQVESLMPKIIRTNHSNLLETFIRGNTKKSEKYKGIVNSYGISKQGFVFPARIHGGLSFDFKDDFVMIGAVMSLETKNLQTWLCELEGQTVNVSKGLFNFFQQKYSKIRVEDFNLLNVYSFLPFIEEAIKKNADFIEGRNAFQIRNLQGFLILPQRINSILDILREKNKEEETMRVDRSQNTFMNNTYRTHTATQHVKQEEKQKEQEKGKEKEKEKELTKRSQKTASIKGGGARYLNTIEKTLINSPNRTNLIRKFQNNELTNMDIVNAIMDTIPVDKYQISLDLNFHRHIYGEADDDNFVIFSLTTNFNHTDLLNRTVKTERTDKSEDEELPTALDMNVNNVPNNESVVIKKIFSRTEKLEENNKKIIVDNENENGNPEGNGEDPISIRNRSNISNDEIHQKKEIERRNNHSEVSDEAEDENLERTYNEKSKRQLEKNNEDRIEKSQGSSSVDSVKQAFIVFNKMKFIQNSVPLSVKRNFLAIIAELFFVILYCVLYWIFASSYVETYYRPTQKNLINLCKMSSSVYLTTILSAEIEYERLGLSEIGEDAEIFKNFLNSNFEIINEIGNEKVSEVTEFEYQNLYKTYVMEIVDFQSRQTKNITYADLISLNSIIIASIIHADHEMNYDMLINLQRNFPSFLTATSVILSSTEDSFLNSNGQTTNSLLILMITFLLIKLLLKLVEFKLLYDYQKRITQLLNLLKRVNESDASREIVFCQEIIKIMNESSELYLQIDFSDKCLNRYDSYSDPNLMVKTEANVNRGKDKSKFKKKSMYDFKPLPVMRIIFFVGFFAALSFSFFFFNFYYWSAINENIKNLIEINIFFEKLYYLSISTLCIQKSLLRVEIVPDSDYMHLKSDFQNQDYRFKYFKEIFDDKVKTLKEIVAFSLGKYSLQAKNDINSKIFSDLIQYDVCQVLFEKNLIPEKYIEICLGSLNGGFKKGIISVVNQYLNEVITLDNFLDVPKIDYNNNQEFKDYLKEKTEKDIIVSAKFLNDALLLYYSFINDYYNGIMESQINGLKLFLLATTVIFFLIIFLLASFMKVFLKKIYKYCALTLGIIPLERILNDKPTIFLINQFVKDGQSE